MRRCGVAAALSCQTGPGGDAKSHCAILRATKAFQSLRLIFLQLRSADLLGKSEKQQIYFVKL